MQSKQADRANQIEYRIKISRGIFRTIRTEKAGNTGFPEEREKRMGRVSELQIREAIANFKFSFLFVFFFFETFFINFI